MTHIPETLEMAQAHRDELRQKISDVSAVVDDLYQQMTANIPLRAPDPAWDPNDEFKRCAKDRQARTADARNRIKEILAR